MQTDGDDMAHKGTQAILLQDVEKLGRKGDVVNVAPGYMRNYLAPRRLAMQANDGLVAQVQRQEDMRRRHEAQSDEQAREMAHTLNRTVLTVKARAGTEDRLYGSVTSTDIADAIWKARRIRIDRRKVELDEPIKALGSYKVGDHRVQRRAGHGQGDGRPGAERRGRRRRGVRGRAGRRRSGLARSAMAVEQQQAPNVPPHDLDAEESVLGAMLVSANAISTWPRC